MPERIHCIIQPRDYIEVEPPRSGGPPDALVRFVTDTPDDPSAVLGVEQLGQLIRALQEARDLAQANHRARLEANPDLYRPQRSQRSYDQ